MSKPENPPAFPVYTGDGDRVGSMEFVSVGSMPLRDYFAGQALAGVLASKSHPFPMDGAEHYAKGCYALADAMLAERSKPWTWQSIDTAPKDVPILTYRGAGLMSVAARCDHPADLGKKKPREIWICTDGCELLHVTHWMPLPETPK